MNKALSLAFLAGGVVAIVFGINAMNSLNSHVSRFFTGAPTDTALWLLVGGAAASIVGLVGLSSGPRSG